MRMRIVTSVALCALATLALAPNAHPAAGGTVAGKVTFTGTPPKMKPIDMAKEPSCAKEHADAGDERERRHGRGKLARQRRGLHLRRRPAPAPRPRPRQRSIRRTASTCPHVLAMQAGQKLEIKNDDQTSHNIHPLSKVNAEWNKSQPPGSPPIEATYDKPEFIPVKCNVHPWMHGYFAVLNTSHSGVTGSDGTYQSDRTATRASTPSRRGMSVSVRRARKSRSPARRPRSSISC